ncbi:class II glutamine amidotransferase [Acidianus sulfidivorans JP7]|nr:class II glutamine amidotransferase [Acidianus sulfidivorans JP7]
MFAYYGNSKDRVKELFECLKKAAKEDIYYPKPHEDGWGLVLLTRDKLIHYRDINPIYYTDAFPLNLKDEEMMVIVHARQASDKDLVSSFYSHPYLETDDKYVYYLAHNGSVDKEEIAKELKIYNAKYLVDSELLLKYIIFNEDYEKIKKYTKSSLNIILLKIQRDTKEASLYFMNYYNSEYIKLKNMNEKYYPMYYSDIDGKAVFSSTVGFYCGENREVEKGKLIELGRMKIR